MKKFFLCGLLLLVILSYCILSYNRALYFDVNSGKTKLVCSIGNYQIHETIRETEMSDFMDKVGLSQSIPEWVLDSRIYYLYHYSAHYVNHGIVGTIKEAVYRYNLYEKDMTTEEKMFWIGKITEKMKDYCQTRFDAGSQIFEYYYNENGNYILRRQDVEKQIYNYCHYKDSKTNEDNPE